VFSSPCGAPSTPLMKHVSHVLAKPGAANRTELSPGPWNWA
jgi:hypothetical protein